MTDRVAVAGVGQTRFTKQVERGNRGLVEEAVNEALRDAGIRSLDVEAVFGGSVAAGNAFTQKALKDMAFGGAPMINIENACASSTTALRDAYAWVKAGLVDVALALGVEILTGGPKGPLRLPKGEWIFDTGLNLPAWYALHARRHMSEYGTTVEQLASVAVKSRQLAANNPFAHFRTPTTIEEVLGSPTIADPITLYQCCPKTDGASAAVVMSERAAERFGVTAPAWIRGTAMGSGTAIFTDSPVADALPKRMAAKALAEAGVDAGDLDVAEVHDAFTIGEILYSEALGVCAPGEGGRYVESGKSMPGGGGVAINPSGGLLSRGHPLGATGLAQVGEVVRQLRGTASNQVEGARLAATHTMGASEFELEGNVCTVFVFERG